MNESYSFCLFERCLGLDHLTFFVDLELISFESADSKMVHVSKCPVLECHIEYEWALRGDELVHFKESKMGEMVFSPNFGNGCISVYCTPKGFLNAEDMRFGLEFHRLP